MGWYEAVKDATVVADRLRDVELKHRLCNRFGQYRDRQSEGR